MNTSFKAQRNMPSWIAKVLVQLFGSFFLLMTMGAQAQIVQYEGMSDPGFGWSRSWIDVNNDGKDDYCVFTGDTAQNVDCYLSNGTTFGPLHRYSLGSGVDPSGFRWVEVNGDGQIDFCRLAVPYRSATETITCWMGPDFSTSIVAATPVTSTVGTAGMFVVDVNGDGRSDVCYISGDSSLHPTYNLQCMLYNGAGFDAPTGAWTFSTIDPGMKDWSRGFYDFNGDGYPDFCRILTSKQLRCTLVGPNGFATSEVTSGAIDASIKEGAAFVDINGDGNIDFCRLTGSAAAQMPLGCVMSNGVAWEVSERTSLSSNGDVLRLYEKWLRTGSRRSADLLAARGIVPNASVGSHFVQ